MRINDTISISVFTSSRDDKEPFIGLKLEGIGDYEIMVKTPPLSLEKAERLIEEIQEAQAYVDQFESMRGKQRRTMSSNHQ